MGAAAEVGPVALTVELDLLVGRNRVDQLDLERFALLLEEGLRLVPRYDGLRERPVAGDNLAHALLDRREILGGERLGTIEVVVIAVLDHRPDRHLRIRPKRLHRLRHDMRRVVPDEPEGARVVAG